MSISKSLINRTREVVICENIEEAKTHKEKSHGLIKSDGKTALFFKTRWGIHTFGMAFSIDIAILDKKMKVVKYKRNLKPSRILFWNLRFNKVIEIPTILLQEEMIKIGDELCIS
ncbi:hypothetical protein CL629_03590 [bacterium]|nr:hypothetical protein [bacterium]|tara:strand:- start:6600 stop:6944 length:345 start_codon:yes stop_codon:yes gene_type:complete